MAGADDPGGNLHGTDDRRPGPSASDALAARDDGDEPGVFVELAAEFLAVAERDVELFEMYADLVFGLDRAGALVAFLEPELLGEEDAFGEIRAIADFAAAVLAAIFLADMSGVCEEGALCLQDFSSLIFRSSRRKPRWQVRMFGIGAGCRRKGFGSAYVRPVRGGYSPKR